MSSEQRSLASRQFPKLEIVYSLMYLSLLIPGIAFVIWYEYAYKAGDGIAETLYASIVGIGQVGVADAAVTVGIIEGGAAIIMLARMMLERAERRGIEQGIEQGKNELQRKWQSWNHRRMTAAEEGREFDDLPPSLDDTGSNA